MTTVGSHLPLTNGESHANRSNCRSAINFQRLKKFYRPAGTLQKSFAVLPTLSFLPAKFMQENLVLSNDSLLIIAAMMAQIEDGIVCIKPDSVRTVGLPLSDYQRFFGVKFPSWGMIFAKKVTYSK
ncbi:MAG: hypothetical protein LBP65_04040 [Puniceicoccales bacterium]|nr:hypothetical protein [Puniceicoccales bacterium]